ncbi:MAG: ribosome small subunit-dependent GTPase A [Propionibacteriaceae bacterium]|jgi:ribosome biogenesis GTPase|nr:ribosome small subunit-dependent GTPase A [Propionibacteriaceae bacterium]
MARAYRGAITDDPHAGFGRPAKRSRPRTKDRPAYEDAEPGLVITVDRGRFRCLVGETTVTATKARSLGRTGVIVGDHVRIVGDTSGAAGTLARIVQVDERRTVLRRTADDDDPYERPIVANADQLAIVTALADPPPRPGMIDRILVAAYDGGLDPLLVFTKSDLASVADMEAIYAPLGLRMVTSEPGADLTALRELLAGRVSVFVGHSGVGKSTLVNALIPGVDRATGDVNEVTGRGRHTSTSAIALRLPFGGWVIDTPGVRSFGLSHVTIDSIIAAFPDLAELTADCPRGCTHEAGAIDCALDEAVAAGRLNAERLESFRRMEKAWR